MTLGDVIVKERTNKELAAEDAASRLNVSLAEYSELESGTSPIEEWGPRLAEIAINLGVPTSRLISETGQFSESSLKKGQCGRLISGHRKRRNLSVNELSNLLDLPENDLADIEKGTSPLEIYAPILLGIAEIIEQPIFNLFYPCGLPFSELDDYP